MNDLFPSGSLSKVHGKSSEKKKIIYDQKKKKKIQLEINFSLKGKPNIS